MFFRDLKIWSGSKGHFYQKSESKGHFYQKCPFCPDIYGKGLFVTNLVSRRRSRTWRCEMQLDILRSTLSFLFCGSVRIKRALCQKVRIYLKLKCWHLFWRAHGWFIYQFDGLGQFFQMAHKTENRYFKKSALLVLTPSNLLPCFNVRNYLPEIKKIYWQQHLMQSSSSNMLHRT